MTGRAGSYPRGRQQRPGLRAAIAIELEQNLHRKVTLSVVHVTLYRLEDKGYAKIQSGRRHQRTRWRSKRMYSITNSGIAVLKDDEADPHGSLATGASTQTNPLLNEDAAHLG